MRSAEFVLRTCCQHPASKASVLEQSGKCLPHMFPTNARKRLSDFWGISERVFSHTENHLSHS